MPFVLDESAFVARKLLTPGVLGSLDDFFETAILYITYMLYYVQKHRSLGACLNCIINNHFSDRCPSILCW